MPTSAGHENNPGGKDGGNARDDLSTPERDDARSPDGRALGLFRSDDGGTSLSGLTARSLGDADPPVA
jgi:hypothetical protein